MTKTKNNNKMLVLTVVIALLLVNIYIVFRNVAAFAAEEPGFNKRQACITVGCPDTNLRLCAEIHATVGGFGVVYKCYEPEILE